MKTLKEMIRLKIWAPYRINKHASYYSSHSQFGEDMVLRSILNQNVGTYIDIGAHHPVYYSNTYHFYLKGWRGLNIDAIPGSMKIFNQIRSKDKNIEACLSDKDNQDMVFYEFSQPAYNTIDQSMAEEALKKGQDIKQKHTLKTKTLTTILKEQGFANKEIDFLNIDIEGVDEIILKSNDWNIFKPKVIAFEDHNFDLHDLSKSSTLLYLEEQGYKFEAKCGPTIIVKLS